MNARASSKRVSHGLMSLAGLAVGCALAVPPVFAGEGSPASAAPTQAGPAAVPDAGAGMTVHVDPRTGQILEQPAPGTEPLQLSPQERSRLSTSHQGLVEVPVPGGGYKLDLQGRFQSPLIGTVGGDGKLRMQHLGAPRTAGEHP
jgi:hypothetical protein